MRGGNAGNEVRVVKGHERNGGLGVPSHTINLCYGRGWPRQAPLETLMRSKSDCFLIRPCRFRNYCAGAARFLLTATRVGIIQYPVPETKAGRWQTAPSEGWTCEGGCRTGIKELTWWLTGRDGWKLPLHPSLLIRATFFSLLRMTNRRTDERRDRRIIHCRNH